MHARYATVQQAQGQGGSTVIQQVVVQIQPHFEPTTEEKITNLNKETTAAYSNKITQKQLPQKN
jgi:hypothetical protein